MYFSWTSSLGMGGLFFLAMLPLQLVASSDMSIDGFLMMDGISKEVDMFLIDLALFVTPIIWLCTLYILSLRTVN